MFGGSNDLNVSSCGVRGLEANGHSCGFSNIYLVEKNCHEFMNHHKFNDHKFITFFLLVAIGDEKYLEINYLIIHYMVA